MHLFASVDSFEQPLFAEKGLGTMLHQLLTDFHQRFVQRSGRALGSPSFHNEEVEALEDMHKVVGGARDTPSEPRPDGKALSPELRQADFKALLARCELAVFPTEPTGDEEA